MDAVAEDRAMFRGLRALSTSASGRTGRHSPGPPAEKPSPCPVQDDQRSYVMSQRRPNNIGSHAPSLPISGRPCRHGRSPWRRGAHGGGGGMRIRNFVPVNHGQFERFCTVFSASTFAAVPGHTERTEGNAMRHMAPWAIFSRAAGTGLMSSMRPSHDRRRWMMNRKPLCLWGCAT